MNNLQPKISKSEINLVMDLYSTGQFKEAVEKIKELNNKFPNVPILFNLIGACYKELGHLEGSAKMFENAINIKPDYAEAHFNLGAVLKILNKDNESIQSYRNAIAINHKYPDALNNLGRALHELGEYDEAIDLLEWAIAYKHDFSEAHNNLGNVLNDIGKVSEAIESFKKAITHNPNYSSAYYNLASAHKDIGNKNAYLKYIEKAVQLRPNWGEANFNLSQVKDYSNEDPHIKKMESLLKINNLELTDQIGLNFALAHAYDKLGNHEKQFKFLNEANKLRKQEANYSFSKDKNTFALVKALFNSSTVSLEKLKTKSI